MIRTALRRIFGHGPTRSGQGPMSADEAKTAKPAAESCENALGEFVLNQLEAYSASVGGEVSGLASREFRETVYRQTGLPHMNRAQQHFQTAMMPSFRHNLYDFYKAQEWLIFLNFISYPFQGSGCLDAQLVPYAESLNHADRLRVLDYGAGIPYGLLSLLKEFPERVDSVCIVDLDLAHTYFIEYLIRKLAPDAELRFHRLRNAQEIPELGHSQYSMIYAKDVFEHVHDPESLLTRLLDSCAAEQSVAFFDLRDHGPVTLQHVSPDLAGLNEVISERGFSISTCDGLTRVVRT